MSSALNVVDPDLALERAGGNQELACELYQMLQNELPNYFNAIQQHYQDGDYEALLETVHKLHGSANYCGVPALGAAASRLEGILKQHGENTFGADLNNVLTEIQRLQRAPQLNL